MKTYLFAIGGTGARVIKSLTMLLSAGVEINTDEIVPIFIDPDAAAANLTETERLLDDYSYINKHFSFTSGTKNRFFKTRITKLTAGFRLELANTQDERFRQYMGFDALDVPNKALAYMLFSEANLESDMGVGFKGNPNIGSVVLNQFSQTDAFTKLANEFQQGDRIFIISSIFGGTGASGFPLLLKNLRGIDPKNPNADAIRNAPIGAISVLPYFNIEQVPDAEIDSSTFISKTRAALEYYAANITGNQSLNAMYYLGDTPTTMYSYSAGGAMQKNKAHLMELIAALAVIDFCALDADRLETEDGKASLPVYKEFGVKEDKALNFSSFYDETRDLLQKPLAQFTLWCKYLNEQLPDSKNQAWAKGKRPFDASFFRSAFFQRLSSIKDAYLQWLSEMKENHRTFAPFHLEETKNDVFGLIDGVVPRKIVSLKSNYALFDDRLNAIEPKIGNNLDESERFVELFYQATEKLVTKKKLD